MDPAALYPVFLIIGWLQAIVAHVEPPANVTLQCHNWYNVLKWSYDQLSPGLSFKVSIRSTADITDYPNELWVNPPAELQADVSFLSDPTKDYYLEVTAVVGKNESDPAPPDGITFSYYRSSPAYQKCYVDFPAVNVTALHDDVILVRFTHPWLVYHQKLSSGTKTKSRKRKSHDEKISAELPVFHYDVIIINQKEQHHWGGCFESVCEEKFSVDPSRKKYCLRMSGELEKISVKATQDYCVLLLQETPSYLIPIYVVASLLVLIAIALVLFMVYRKMTTPLSSPPDSMKFKSKLIASGISTQDTMSVSEVEAHSPTLLLPEKDEYTPTATISTEPNFRLAIGVFTTDEGVCDIEEARNDEGSGYMPGRNMDEDDALYSSDVPSGYEKREVVDNLAPDELTKGYRG